jgi:hypothetical protein
MSTFQKIDEQVKRETGGAAVYRGIYRTGAEGGPVLLRFMAACQALPTRIRELIADARKEGSAIRDKLEIALRGMELGEVEDFELFRPGAKNRASERPKKLEVGAPELAPGAQTRGGNRGALLEAAKLVPADVRIDDAETGEGRKSAIRSGDDPVCADRLRIALESLRHEFRMLYEIGGGIDHAWNEDLVVRYNCEHLDKIVPVMLVSWVGGLKQ